MKSHKTTYTGHRKTCKQPKVPPQTWALISCNKCTKEFPGALYDGQPNDVCYDCFRETPMLDTPLWKKLYRLGKDDATKMIQILVELEQDGLIAIKRD